MNIADWAILVVVLLSTIQAAYSGFFQEAFHLAGLVVGYLLAAWQYQHVAGWLERYLKSVWVAESAGFLVIFFAVAIAAGIAGRAARWVMKKSGLSFVDRLLGGTLGFLRGCLIVAVITVSMTAFMPTSRWLAGSEWAPYFQAVGRAAIWVAPAELRARFYQGLDLLRRMPHTVPAGAAPSQAPAR
ncbi:MAG: CvpA family protein [Terriglobales bacterium]